MVFVVNKKYELGCHRIMKVCSTLEKAWEFCREDYGRYTIPYFSYTIEQWDIDGLNVSYIYFHYHEPLPEYQE